MRNDTITLSGTRSINDTSDKIRLYLPCDSLLNGEKDSYLIEDASPIGRGGESLVYKAKRVSDGLAVALKFYDNYFSSVITNYNRCRIIEILKYSEYKESHLMPLLDNGNHEVVSITGEKYEKPFDVLPFVEGGHLTKAEYETLKEDVIPQINAAINFLHKNGIIHRDIKPSNIYYYEGIFLLSDFGIASEKMDNRETAYTSVKKASLGYAPPEVSMGYITETSDMYSFGVTIASLLNGKHIYETLVKSGNQGELYLAIKKNGFPLNCKHSDLQMLVNALTVLDEEKRATEKDVKNWCDNYNNFERKWKNMNLGSSGELVSQYAFHFENTICKDNKELADAFVNNWEQATKYLYKGGINNSAVVKFFSTYNQALSVKAIDIIEKDSSTARNYDLGLAQFIHYLYSSNGEANSPICWKGKTYKSFADISKNMQDNANIIDDIEKLIDSGYLTWKVKNSYNIEKKQEILDVLSEVDGIRKSDKEVGYYLFMYLFSKEKPITLSPDGYFKELIDKREFYNAICQFKLEKKTIAYLASNGYYDYVSELLKTNCSTEPEKLEQAYRFFESICEDKELVRRHYLEYGPRAYLFYWKEHINEYVTFGENAESLVKRINDVIINTQTIDVVFETSQKLRELLNDFMFILQNNIYLANMGIRDGKTIIPKTKELFFNEEYFDIKVPEGFYLKVKEKYE